MKKKTKNKIPSQTIVQSPKVIEVPTPPPVATRWQLESQREDWYTPHLAHWQYFANPISEDGRTLEIHEADDKGNTGALVATITVAPEFSKINACDIANLMAGAPALFRNLRSIAACSMHEVEDLAEFNTAVETMWCAIGHYPYQYPERDKTDEDRSARLNECRGVMRNYRREVTSGEE